MTDPAKAIATQLANIEKRSGKSLEQLVAALRASGLGKHGELRALAQSEFGLGYGDANTLVHHAAQAPAGPGEPAAGGSEAEGDVIDGLYAGPKAALRPVHDAVMSQLAGFGAFEIAPKKTYLSLRRSKQFATIGPATRSQVEVGLNMKGVPGTTRLAEQAPGGMCSHKVRLATVAEVDAELLGWLRQAFDGAA